ncbi:SPOR domain-containing protein [Thiohalophilus sp.]|uniref:SPOR domain-containing protein n=1 Tax=Thiohalophilus sp. TaxID=3028392 RepID=UPI002ACE2ABA|nr:SPOR domain-containing protein [Thiohalophilus sp.]MDZ7802645.1 SPOR domain-containing protein [Thiohalophilus sp.]
MNRLKASMGRVIHFPFYLATAAVLLMGLMINPAFADTVAQALSASQRGEHDRALSILKQRAEADDPVAQYDLALFYKNGIGVASNRQLAKYWFKRAARGGIVNAYAQLRQDAVQPGQPPQVELVFGPQEWIRVQEPGNYTLQLASSRNSRLIKRYYVEYQLQGRGGYFLNKKRNQYALVYGTYPSVADATRAIETLPEALRQWQPWVRQLRQIQASMADE